MVQVASKVIRQKQWTHEELAREGFQYFKRKKQLVMARMLPPEEAPKTIVTAWDTLVAKAGYVICYTPGDVVWPSLEDYHQWPLEPRIFRETYRRWPTKDWKPSATEKHLMQLGCKPFYKVAGVWAKKMTETTLVQSLESPQPVPVPPGVWVSIGVQGEPYTMSDLNFRTRYEHAEQARQSLVEKLIGFLRGR